MSFLRRALPIVVLFALPCLLLWRAVFLGEAFVPADLLRDIAPWRPETGPAVPWNVLRFDGALEFYPWRAFYADTIRSGYLPLWNPHEFCGTPFVGNSQSAIFYPLNLIFVLLPVAKAFGASVVVHLTLTGCLLYAFLRRAVGAGRVAALSGAIVWQLSTWQVSWLALPTFLCVSAWLPAVLLGVYAVTARPTVPRATLLAGAIALTLLAGHLQVAVYCLLLATAYALFRLWQTRAERRTGLAFGLLALALAAAFVAGSAQLLPSVELSRLSHRAGAGASMAGYQGYIALTAMPAWHLVTLFLPDFYGNPSDGTYWGFTNYAENACYVGIVGLLLALAGIAGAWRTRPETRFFTSAGVFAALVAIGTPLAGLLYFGIPGFAQTGSPARILVIWTFSAAVLAGLGVDALAGRLPDARAVSRVLGRAAGALLLAFAAAAGYALWWLGNHAPAGALAHNLANEASLWRLPAALLLVLGLAGVQHARGKLSRAALGRVAAGLAAFDLLLTGIAYNRTVAPADVYPVTPAIAFLKQHRTDGRVMPLNRDWHIDRAPHAILPPNGLMAYGLDDVQGYDSLFPGQYMSFAASLNHGVRPTPDANGNMVFTWGYDTQEAAEAGARYVISQGTLPESPTLHLVSSTPDALIYENAAARARVVDGAGQACAALSPAPTRLSFVATQDAGGGVLAVVHDQYFPGWRGSASPATQPGESRPVTIAKGPDVFRTVTAPDASAGPLRVTLTYAPASVQVGLYGLLLAIAVASAVVAGAAVKAGGRGVGAGRRARRATPA